LPHSEIRGSKGARPSPRLFAACHVLLRLSVPRHPPNALTRLIRSPAAAHREQNPPQARTRASIDNSALILYPPGRPKPPPRPRQTPPAKEEAQPKSKASDPNSQSHSYPQCQRADVRSRKTQVSHTALATPAPLTSDFRHPPIGPGGADRDRTGDLLLAKQALSQLSYGPDPKPVIRRQKSVTPRSQPPAPLTSDFRP
jgi:hypothetical protein